MEMATPKFTNAIEFQKMVDDYFADCDKHNKPYTISGLAYALGTSRKVLLTYKKLDFLSIDTNNNAEIQAISNSVKKAKQKCEKYAEEYLFIGKNQIGCIFNLKNNYSDWKDKSEIVNINKEDIDDLSESELRKAIEQIEDTID